MLVNDILELLKYTIPALIVFLTAYSLLTRYMQKEATAKAIEMKLKRDKEIVMLRLQAYERLALFLEIPPFERGVHDALTWAACGAGPAFELGRTSCCRFCLLLLRGQGEGYPATSSESFFDLGSARKS